MDIRFAFDVNIVLHSLQESAGSQGDCHPPVWLIWWCVLSEQHTAKILYTHADTYRHTPSHTRHARTSYVHHTKLLLSWLGGKRVRVIL